MLTNNNKVFLVQSYINNNIINLENNCVIEQSQTKDKRPAMFLGRKAGYKRNSCQYSFLFALAIIMPQQLKKLRRPSSKKRVENLTV